jgi:hypothetical protein
MLNLIAVVFVFLMMPNVAMARITQRTLNQEGTPQSSEIQSPDPTFSVIEFPVNKEVAVKLIPDTTLRGSKGSARVFRSKEGTKIIFNFSDLPGDVTNLNVYLVDAKRSVIALDRLTTSSGKATQTLSTPLSTFMILVSRELNLAVLRPDTPILFRSAVPSGFIAVREDPNSQTVNVGTPVNSTPQQTYDIPLLGVPNIPRGTSSERKVKTSGAMSGGSQRVFLEPRKDGTTRITLWWDNLKEPRPGKCYVLWAVSPENQYVQLGLLPSKPGKAEIQKETALPDFGLLVTLEDCSVPKEPRGPLIATVI